MSAPEITPYLRTMQYLQSLGIDSQRVLLDDFAIDGYWVISLDGEGKRVVEVIDGERNIKTELHEWPSKEVALHAVDLYLKDKFGVK